MTPAELISHPAHPAGDPELSLQAHSEAVRDRMVPLFRGRSSPKTVSDVVAYLHDFGKVTPQFQAYISPEEQYDGPKTERYHARLGAAVTLYALDEMGFDISWVGAGTLAVARHHQPLPDAAEYFVGTLRDALSGDAFQAQVSAVDDRWPSAADELVTEATDGDASWQGFQSSLADGTLNRLLVDLGGRKELTGIYSHAESIPGSLYERSLHLWGSLTLADKSHAKPIETSDIHDFDTLDRTPLERHIKSLQGTDDSELEKTLNEDRRDGLQQVLAGVHEWADCEARSRIGTITLPTGLGKTFTGLMAALTLRDKTPVTDRETSVIYCLPYTSIIEQTREHFENPDIWNASPQDDAFTVHHYLSDTVVQHGDEATADDTFLGESWRSGVVLTTFVQLFESLAGPSNHAGTKLSALDNAVVILDEPQALPKHWWDGVQRLLRILTDEFGAQVISMTATQPALVEGLDTISLLDVGAEHTAKECDECGPDTVPSRSVQSYFDASDRVTYELHPSAVSHSLEEETRYVGHEEGAEEIRTAAGDDGSVLAVCNTIASCRTLTRAVTDSGGVHHIGKTYQELIDTGQVSPRTDTAGTVDTLLEECGLTETDSGWVAIDDSVPLLVASFNSRFRPVDRDVLLEVVGALGTAPVPFVLVSTQAVEAGVDVSFQQVYRDIAPVDSIVQAGGRCNRNFEWGRKGGTVTVWTLAATDEPSPSDPDQPCPASHIYNRDIPGHLRLVADTLSSASGTTVSEREMCYDTVRTYFQSLSTEKSIATAEIREEINRAEAKALGERSLIDGWETVDVLLPFHGEATDSVNQLMENLEEGNIADVPATLSELADIRVSVPVERVPNSATVETDSDLEIEILAGTSDGLSYNTVDGVVADTEAAGGSTEI